MKFEKGEIAIIYLHGNPLHGKECEIVTVGPIPAGVYTTGPAYYGWPQCAKTASDYEIRIDDIHWHCLESSLRKRRPPIPDETTRLFDGRPVECPDKVGEPA